MLNLTKGQIPRRAVRCVLFVAALGTLVACSNVRPFSYTAIHEIPPGPGLVSGDDGVFVLYRGDRSGSAE
ncbi:MAG TPA: hypothetical protein ENO14_00820 [Chromatiales bacterium]|nr:hypothetical protein [Chromatiales bacterium]